LPEGFGGKEVAYLVSESLAILLVILVMAVMYRRAGKKDISILALPLVCVPCARLVSAGLFGADRGDTPLYSYMVEAAGLVAAIFLCTLLSRNLESRSVRVVYLAFSFVFSAALNVAYLI